ncbi:unnamed protein product [Parascedosporium putredinis]|uniref:J domain-containing protein n=1 Tax=Parascedosporium putredinis TaxID=1442378 RepID=A0A9P1H884_9PEZI|nr:unnamed protein product [Parascedosporium putredinis]CAI8000703.1 unnamed protein product [Parascedosporium putredinis]
MHLKPVETIVVLYHNFEISAKFHETDMSLDIPGTEVNVRNLNELLALAKDYATKEVSLYDILGVPSDALDKEIHRGWRRQNLQHHPDKTRDAFDPVAYERIGHAKDKAERDRMDREKRRYIDELEAAEKVARTKKEEEAEKLRELDRERERLRQEGLERRDREDREFKEKAEKERMGPSLDEQEAEILAKMAAKAQRRAEKAQKKADKSAARGTDKTAPKVASYYYSTDPTLSYEEKVAGVMAKLRARQKERDERKGPAQADVVMT